MLIHLFVFIVHWLMLTVATFLFEICISKFNIIFGLYDEYIF